MTNYFLELAWFRYWWKLPGPWLVLVPDSHFRNFNGFHNGHGFRRFNHFNGTRNSFAFHFTSTDLESTTGFRTGVAYA